MKGRKVWKMLCTSMLAAIMSVPNMSGIVYAEGDTDENIQIVSSSYEASTTSAGVPSTDASYLTDEGYAAFGFSNLKDINSYVEEDLNPLEGYQPMIQSELYIGYMNRNADHQGNFATAEQASTASAGTLNLDTMMNTNVGGKQSYYDYDNMQTQCINAVGLIPGDMSETGADVRAQIIIESRLYQDTDGKDSSDHMVRAYSLVNGSWKGGEAVTRRIDGSWDWVGDITVREQGGFNAMTTGDFDGDNKNEVAVHNPYSSDGGGCIYIYEPVLQSGGTYNLAYDGEYWIKDLGNRFNWGDGSTRPLVSMTTTDMAGYDAIVLSVTLPYDDQDEACDAGVVAVIENTGGKNYSKIWWDTMVIGNEEARYKLQNVTNADLNGDGQDEIVIAGHINTGYKNKSTRGNIDKDNMYINVLLHNGSEYYLAWSDSETPKVPRHPDLHVDNSGGDGDSENDPISLTAGKYHVEQENDTVFCEGVFLDFVAASSEKDADQQIIKGKFTCDQSQNLVFSNTDEAFIGPVATGSFIEDQNTVEQTVVISGHNAQGDDSCDMYVTWFYGSTDKNNNEVIGQIESNDDYFNNDDEDDDGTLVVLAAVNVDDDSYYIKYKERYYGYSNPALVGVMISQPYWKELDYGASNGSTSFTITYSNGTSKTHEGSVGFDFSLSYGGKAEVVGTVAKAGFDMNFAASYIHSKTHGTTKSESLFFNTYGQDAVVLTVVPIVTYNYDLLRLTNGGVEKETFSVNTSYTPAFTKMNVDEYNDVASQYNEQLSDGQNEITLIDLDEVYYDGYTAGDPSSYPSSIGDIAGIDGEYRVSSNQVSVNVGDGSSGIELSKETIFTKTHGLSLSLALGGTVDMEFGLKIFGIGGGSYLNLAAHLTGGYGYTYAETNSNGHSYSGTMADIPRTANSDYAYTTQLVVWEHNQNVIGETEDEEVVYEAIPYIGYITDAKMTPPRTVTDLKVVATTKSLAMLNWTKPSDRINSNGDTVSVDHYKLYMSTSLYGDYSEVAEIDGSKTSYTVTGLERNTTYYFKIQGFTKENDESILSSAAKGTTLADGAPIINKHPQDMVIGLAPGNTWGNGYNFSVEAVPYSADGTLSYQWERLTNGSWKKIEGETDTQYKTETTFPEDDGLEVRCVITETQTDGTMVSITSLSATLTVLSYEDYPLYSKEQTEISIAFYAQGSGDDEYPIYEGKECYQSEGKNVDMFLLLTTTTGFSMNPNLTYSGQVYLYDVDKGVVVDGYPMDITYDASSGVELKDIELEKGNYYVVATFDGNDNYTGTTSPTGIIHITDNAEIEYVLNGGVNNAENPTWYNENWTNPLLFYAPTKEGANFLGWYLDDGFNTKVPYSDSYEAYMLNVDEVDGNVLTLYAKWEDIIEEYSVTYELDGGENAADNPATIKENQQITLSDPTKAGYEFDGWYLDAEFTTGCETISGAEGKNITVYAKWGDPTEYKINYVIGDGVNAESNPETYTIESADIVFADPTLDGYAFDGWYTNADHTTRITSIPTGSTGDVTVYAKWTLIDTLVPNEEGIYEIDSYEDLIELARMVKYNPEKYAGAAYTQTANIDCDNQSWPLGIGSVDHPFEGTYLGNNYYIYGLRPTSDVSGLFGVIGENGVVQNVSVVDFDYTTEARLAGGLAGINYGTIIGCGSGEILSSATILADDGNVVLPSELASDIKAINMAGGLAAINEGAIQNCANGSNVTIVVEEEAEEDESAAGGIAAINNGVIQGVYQVGEISGASVMASVVGENSGTVENSYYLDSTAEDSTSTAMTKEQFTTGEVAYLLNKEVTDGTQDWYQNLDNGKVPNLNPKIANNGDNTVYEIREEGRYSNYSPYDEKESVLERVELRTYQRVRDENGKFSEESKIAYGYGVVDNDNKTITVYTTNKVERLGILMHQGQDGALGVMRLQGDYDKLEETSKELLESGKEEPDIYTDGNGCIFVKIKGKTNEDIPELTATFEQKPTENYEPTEYTVIVKIVDPDEYKNAGVTQVRTLSADDPDYDVVLDESVVIPDDDTDKPSDSSSAIHKIVVKFVKQIQNRVSKWMDWFKGFFR